MNIKSAKLFTSGSFVVAIIALLAINIFANATFTSGRLDLTDNKLYTLSQGTRNILAQLPESITVRLFLSQKLATRLPGITSYASRVRELLEEYQRAAGGNIQLSIIEPEPFSESEDEAVGYGLRGVPLNDGENTFYFGMVATGSTNEESVIDFFSPQREEFVEYDITKAIQQVAFPKKKVVGLLSTLNIDGSPDPSHMAGLGAMPRSARPWAIVDQMRQLFEIKKLDNDIRKIPDDIDVLMLVHPKDLGEPTLYAIDQFVLKGGRALVFVDPHAETDVISNTETGMPGNNYGSSELSKLLNAWGVKMDKTQVVADIQLAQKVGFNFGGRTSTVEFPIWIKLPSDQLNKEDIITSNLGTVNMASPGDLESENLEGIQVTPLIQTTTKATLLPKTRLNLLADPQDLLRGYRSADKVFTLAARITGKVKSAFPEGAPASNKDTSLDKNPVEENPEPPSADHLKESKEDVNLVIVADTDMLEDRFWISTQNLFGSAIAIPLAANGSFVVNALDNLMGSNDLISVRNRGHFSRPFTRVDEIRQQAELKFREKEQELMTRLRETERKLVALQRGKQDDNAVILSAEQQKEIEGFRDEQLKIRKELRQVRHQLRKDIEGLETTVKFINIGLIPIVIGLGGLVIGFLRLRAREASAQKLATKQ